MFVCVREKRKDLLVLLLLSIIWKSNMPRVLKEEHFRGDGEKEREREGKTDESLRRRQRDKLTPAREDGVPTGCGERAKASTRKRSRVNNADAARILLKSPIIRSIPSVRGSLVELSRGKR